MLGSTRIYSLLIMSGHVMGLSSIIVGLKGFASNALSL